jgi:putative peptidoglycan lipid II flippase
LQAALILSVAFFLSRVTGLLQAVLINSRLPDHAAAAYYAAFKLPDTVNYLVAGGAMSITFIPIFTQLLRNEDDRAAWRFFGTISTIMGGVLMLLIVLSMWQAELLVTLLVPGFTEPGKEDTLALAIAMTKVLLPAQLFFYLGGMIVGVLNAHKRFGVTGYTGVVYNLVAIVFGVVLSFLTPMGFAWGILIGAATGNFLMPLIAALKAPPEERLRFRPGIDWKNPSVRRFFLNALPIMLGVSLPVIDQTVVGFFASHLTDASFRNLTTGNRFMLAPLGIVAQAASVAAFPYLASDSAAQDWKKFSDFLRSGLRRLMFLTLPLSVLLILIAQPLMRLFSFGHFDSAAADETAIAFAFYCVGLFAWAGQQFVARGFYAIQDTRTPTIIGSALAVFFFVPLCWFFSFGGVLGLAMATSIGAGAQFIGVTLALNRRLKSPRFDAPLRLERIMGTLLRTGAACAAMAVVGLFVNLALNMAMGSSKWLECIRIAVISSAAIAAFVLAAQRFHIPEWFWLRDKALSRFKRR